jgi:hypothetical protein
MARKPERLWAIAERLGGPLMSLTSRGGLAGLGMTLRDLGALGYRIVADPQPPLLAAYAAWKQTDEDVARGFGAEGTARSDWEPIEKAMLATIDSDKLLAVERAAVEKGKD